MVMDDFWGGVVAQTFNLSEGIRPRLASRFEPAPRMIAQQGPASVESLEVDEQRDAATMTDALSPSQRAAPAPFPNTTENATSRDAANSARFSPPTTPADSGQSSRDLSPNRWNGIEDRLDEINRLLDRHGVEQRRLMDNMGELTNGTVRTPAPHLQHDLSDAVRAAMPSHRSEEQPIAPQPPIVSITKGIEEIVPAPAARPATEPASSEPRTTVVKIVKEQIDTPMRATRISRERESDTPLMPAPSTRSTREMRGEPSAPAPRFNKQDMPRSVSAPAATPTMPTIQVTIGRVEVRAAPAPASAPTRKPVSAPQVMSLEEYLRQRHGGQS